MTTSFSDIDSFELLDRFERKVRFDHYDPYCKEDLYCPDREGTLDEIREELYKRLRLTL